MVAGGQQASSVPQGPKRPMESWGALGRVLPAGEEREKEREENLRNMDSIHQMVNVL